jgi:hypothetical protein
MSAEAAFVGAHCSVSPLLDDRTTPVVRSCVFSASSSHGIAAGILRTQNLTASPVALTQEIEPASLALYKPCQKIRVVNVPLAPFMMDGDRIRFFKQFLD